MTYRPQESVFGPPWLVRLPSALYLLLAAGVVALVGVGRSSASGTWAFRYVVEEDVGRVMSIGTFAGVLTASALASVVRAGMRGVRIYADGVETRDVLSLILPRLKRYRWPQIERVILDSSRIGLDLWDGSRAYLPEVGDRAGLERALEHVALARAIPVRGGRLLPEEIESAEED